MALSKDNLVELLQFMADPTDNTDVAAWYWATALRNYFQTLSIVTANANSTISGGAHILAFALMETFSPLTMDKVAAFAPVEAFMVTVNTAIMGSTLGTLKAVNPPLLFSSNLPDPDAEFTSSEEAIETIAENIYKWSITGVFLNASQVVGQWK